MLVLDASLLLGALLPDEPGFDLPALLEPYEEVLAPWLLWAELRNALLVIERRGRIPADEVDQRLLVVQDLHIILDQMPRSAAVMRLARKHGLSAYDALYLELALHKQADLATFDRTLADAARVEGVRVLP